MTDNKPRAMSEKPQPCRHKRPFCLECHGGEFQGSVSVKRTAIEYLKRNHPSACERAGLCETIGGRQYTVTLSCRSYVLASDYEALQAECEKLRKEAERLDWLDAQNAPFRMGWKCGIAPAGNVQLHTVIQLGASPAKIRDAIDAAMQEQQP